MCADRRITEDGGASYSLIKIAKNKHLIAAAAGLTTSTMAVKKAIAKGASTPEDLIECVDSSSYALVLSRTALWMISEKALWPLAPGVHAIGSGADAAIGFINGALDSQVLPGFTIDLARKAQKHVARRRVDVGGGVDFRYFND